MLTARQEAFCRGLAKGMPASRAYVAAGYDARGNIAEANASRLLRNAKVKDRLTQLQQQAAQKAALTVDDLVQRLERLYSIAVEDRQTGAGVQAIMGIGKLLGLIVDKAEVRAEIVRRPVADPYGPSEMTLEEWGETYGQPKTIEGRINGRHPG